MSISINIINEIKNQFKKVNMAIFDEFAMFIQSYRIIRKNAKDKFIKNKTINEIQKMNCVKESEFLLKNTQNNMKKTIKALMNDNTTQNMNNKNNDNIKHNKLESLTDLNKNIKIKSLYDRILSSNNIEFKDINEPEEADVSIFKIPNFRPPK